jgi:hypothetical protein
LTKNDISTNAQGELHEFNILSEYDKLKKHKNKLGAYDKAIYNICECLIDSVSHDKENGDYSSPENNEKIRQAGKCCIVTMELVNGVHKSYYVAKVIRLSVDSCVLNNFSESKQ